MNIPPYFAHGVFGVWDEVALLTIPLVALGVLFATWYQSRQMEWPDEPYNQPYNQRVDDIADDFVDREGKPHED